MKRNTLSKGIYILETVYWAIIAFVWYKNLFFTNIDGKTTLESNMILAGIVLIGIGFNAFLTSNSFILSPITNLQSCTFWASLP